MSDTIIVQGENFTPDATVWLKNPTTAATKALQPVWKNAKKVEAQVPPVKSGEYYVSIKAEAGESNADKRVTVSNPTEGPPGLEAK